MPLVEPTRSQNSTVSWRRSPSVAVAGAAAGGVLTAGADTAGSTRVPHSPQNFIVEVNPAWQFGHSRASAVPHSLQDSAAVGFSW